MKITAVILFCAITCLMTLKISAQVEGRGTRDERQVISIDRVCNEHPEFVKRLFSNLDLDQQGLQEVSVAVEKQDWPAACDALLTYYRNSEMVRRVRPKLAMRHKLRALRKAAVEQGTGKEGDAQAILKDIITVLSVTAKVPRLPNGRLDWAYNGPAGDREWGWCLNRHYHLQVLLDAYLETNNLAYVRCIDEHIRDWVISNPYPAKKSNTAQWRGLEAYHRVVCWAEIFYCLQQVDEFTPAARILMLSSIPDHAHYLRHFHAPGGNWITMEMNGLATAGICWPEFKDARMWVDYAIEKMVPEMTNQVYPDGVQKELTSAYHWVALYNFEHFGQLLKHSDRKLPAEFDQGLERMWNYLAYAMRPDGYGPLNNDSDRIYYRELVLQAAEIFNRPDWVYIASNGREGKAPDGQPSVVFPWAGQVIMRSGWDKDAQWAFFDIGPWGMGHQHNDKLHLSVSAYGRDLLVDGGRYSYRWGPFRRYFLGSASHNVILIDGQGQNAGINVTTKPLKKSFTIEPDFDYARGVFENGFETVDGEAIHIRAVMYVRGKFWVVVDRIIPDRPFNIQALWHWHPDCTIAVEGKSVASIDAGKGNLRIIPVSQMPWIINIVKGQTEPSIQGWYSDKYNHKQPSPTVIYSTKIDGPATFAWVLIPARGEAPYAKAEIIAEDEECVYIRIEVSPEKPIDVTVPLKEGKVQPTMHLAGQD